MRDEEVSYCKGFRRRFEFSYFYEADQDEDPRGDEGPREPSDDDTDGDR